MDKITFYLYNIDIMDNYIHQKEFPECPQVLEIYFEGGLYEFSILNSGTEPFKPQAGQVNLNRQAHSHSVYHVILYTEGQGEFLFKERRFKFEPGVFVISNPNESHCFPPCGPQNEDVVYKCFSFVLRNKNDRGLELSIPFIELLALYSGMAEQLIGVDYPVNLNKRQVQSVGEMIDDITQSLLLGGEGNSYFHAGCKILTFFNFILDELYLARKAVNIEQNALKKAKNYIERNFRKSFSLNELAAEAAMSPGYFIRSFKQKYHVTPIHYQLELKINAAKTLLKTTELMSREIAFRTGFSDEYYFSKSFKKITGLSPSQFRHPK
jgi:AraC-like DNA-binding protein